MASAAPPTNDNFADAQVLPPGVPVTVTGTNVEATREAGERSTNPLFPPVASGHSVWFSWEATSTGLVTVDTCGSDFGAFPTVYTGMAIDTLWEVSEHDGPGCDPPGGQATFMASAGTIYRVAVDGYASSGFPGSPDSEGAIALRIQATPVPGNDQFANATVLTGGDSEGNGYYTARGSGSNWNAGREAGEPSHTGESDGASVWYSWTPPASGTAMISACGEHGLVEKVYTGDAVNALTPVVGDPPACPVKFSASAGTTYRIAVDGRLDSEAGRAEMSSFSVNASVIEPRTVIRNRKGKSRKRRATFVFASNNPNVGFRCRLDRRAFRPCSSPKVYKRLAPGRHIFRVAAVDAYGNVDPTPAVDGFVILERKANRKAGKSRRRGR